jgi:hypothetical protein
MRTLSLLVAVSIIAACQSPPQQCEAEACASRDSRAPSSVSNAAPDTSGPAAVVLRFYEALDARRYADAYRIWPRAGQASERTQAAFVAQFDSVRRVRATVTDSVRLEGAAGSQYATVPVEVDATTASGATRHCALTFTVRRAMVDGATPEQRAWRIYAVSDSGAAAVTCVPDTGLGGRTGRR